MNLTAISFIDFEQAKLNRALCNVPTFRQGGFVNMGTTKVPEKTLSYPLYLNLVERVELRKRIHFLYKSNMALGFYPAWDFDGPDLPYFGEYKGQLKSTSVEAGPWSLDGRQMVADVKDRMLQAAEAANILYPHQKINIYVREMVPKQFTNNRNWNMKDKVWQAFWSGVRKAQEVVKTISPNIQFIAVTPSSDTTPFEWQDEEKRMPWSKDFTNINLNEINIYLIPCDPFAVIGSTQIENEVLTAFGINRMKDIYYPNFFNSIQSTWPSLYRHKLWNPKDGLSRIMYANPKHK